MDEDRLPSGAEVATVIAQICKLKNAIWKAESMLQKKDRKPGSDVEIRSLLSKLVDRLRQVEGLT